MLSDPEQYINFVHFQDIETALCLEDLKNWNRYINQVCLQIENAKRNKSDEEKDALEIVRLKGVKVQQRLGKRIRELGVGPVLN